MALWVFLGSWEKFTRKLWVNWGPNSVPGVMVTPVSFRTILAKSLMLTSMGGRVGKM